MIAPEHYYRRVHELLTVNNAYLERARRAEAGERDAARISALWHADCVLLEAENAEMAEEISHLRYQLDVLANPFAARWRRFKTWVAGPTAAEQGV